MITTLTFCRPTVEVRLTANNRFSLFCNRCHNCVTVISDNDSNTNFLQAYVTVINNNDSNTNFLQACVTWSVIMIATLTFCRPTMEVRLAVRSRQEGETCTIQRNLSVVDVLMSLVHRLVTCTDVSHARVGYLYVPMSLVHRLVTCTDVSDVSHAWVGYLYVLMSLVLRLVPWELKTRTCSSFHHNFGKHFCDISTLLR